MGWLFGWSSRKDLVDHVTKPWENDQSKIEVIAKKFSGNNMWCVFERTAKLAPTDKERFIVVFLIRGGRGNDCFRWGYKDESEEMGPCEVSCPLKFLDMVPDPGGYATEWRKRVREYHAKRNQKLAVGQIIKLSNGKDYRIIQVRPLRGVELESGNYYRLPRRMLTLQAKEAQ
jgi:hypothetical protein